VSVAIIGAVCLLLVNMLGALDDGRLVVDLGQRDEPRIG
jgi:hypothetical protein